MLKITVCSHSVAVDLLLMLQHAASAPSMPFHLQTKAGTLPTPLGCVAGEIKLPLLPASAQAPSRQSGATANTAPKAACSALAGLETRPGEKPAPFPQILSENLLPARLNSSFMLVTPESPAWCCLASLCLSKAARSCSGESQNHRITE